MRGRVVVYGVVWDVVSWEVYFSGCFMQCSAGRVVPLFFLFFRISAAIAAGPLVAAALAVAVVLVETSLLAGVVLMME